MGLDWLSKGKVIRSVKRIREIGGMGKGPTNYYEWDEAVDELGGQTLGFSGVKVRNSTDVLNYLRQGGAAIIAVDYGRFRGINQRKAGSLTFNGYHAILCVGGRYRDGRFQTRSFDSLLDGRYRGCPDGPVWVNWYQMRNAATAVGKKETGTSRVYALLLARKTDPAIGIDFDEEKASPSIVDALRAISSESERAVLEDALGIDYDPATETIKEGISLA